MNVQVCWGQNKNNILICLSDYIISNTISIMIMKFYLQGKCSFSLLLVPRYEKRYANMH